MLEGFTEVVENIKETVEDVGENIKETVSELTQQKEAALSEGNTEYSNYYENSIKTELGTHQGEVLDVSEDITDAEYEKYYDNNTEQAELGTRQSKSSKTEDPEYAKYYEQNETEQGKGEISFGSSSEINRAKRDIEWAASNGFEGHLSRAQQRLVDAYKNDAKEKAGI